jgi:hypothetical protein
LLFFAQHFWLVVLLCSARLIFFLVALPGRTFIFVLSRRLMVIVMTHMFTHRIIIVLIISHLLNLLVLVIVSAFIFEVFKHLIRLFQIFLNLVHVHSF